MGGRIKWRGVAASSRRGRPRRCWQRRVVVPRVIHVRNVSVVRDAVLKKGTKCFCDHSTYSTTKREVRASQKTTAKVHGRTSRTERQYRWREHRRRHPSLERVSLLSISFFPLPCYAYPGGRKGRLDIVSGVAVVWIEIAFSHFVLPCADALLLWQGRSGAEALLQFSLGWTSPHGKRYRGLVCAMGSRAFFQIWKAQLISLPPRLPLQYSIKEFPILSNILKASFETEQQTMSILWTPPHETSVQLIMKCFYDILKIYPIITKRKVHLH